MEGWMITYMMIFYLSIFIAVLIFIIAVIFFIHKRLGHSSWFRKVLAPAAGIGAGLVGLWIVFSMGSYVSFNYSYLLAENSMTQEMIQIEMAQLKFYSNLTWVLTYIAGVPVTVFAGYLAGKIARQNEVRYGLATGIFMAVAVSVVSFPFLFRIFSSADLAFIWNMLLVVIVILAIMIIIGSAAWGGYFALTQNLTQTLTQSRKNEVTGDLV
jgi:hypothetical protein